MTIVVDNYIVSSKPSDGNVVGLAWHYLIVL